MVLYLIFTLQNDQSWSKVINWQRKLFAMSLCASVYMCYVVTCWERADLLAKGDLLALVCGV